VTKPAYTYDELDQIFRRDGHNDSIGISLVDGLIAALVAGPAFVHPHEWLPLIFNGRLPATVQDTPDHLAVNTILNRYNEVSTTLAQAPRAYCPMFMNDAGRVIVNHWAVGFIRAIALRVEAWSPILLTDMRKTLAPIFVCHELGAGFLPDIAKSEQHRLRASAHHHIADAVVALRQTCTARRAPAFEPTTNRRSRRGRKI
jgi:yecA family protein